jgi:hypothetical protein
MMKGWLVKASTRDIGGRLPMVARFWVSAQGFAAAAAAVKFHIGESDIDIEVEEVPDPAFRALGLRPGQVKRVE